MPILKRIVYEEVVNTLPIAVRWLRDTDPRAEGAAALRNCPASRRHALIAWHEEYAGEVLKLAEEGAERLEVPVCMGDIPDREIAIAKSYAALAVVNDLDVLLLALELLAGDAVARGSARMFLAFAPEKDVRAYLQQLYAWETKWLAAVRIGPS